jgi:hypothetical protein
MVLSQLMCHRLGNLFPSKVVTAPTPAGTTKHPMVLALLEDYYAYRLCLDFLGYGGCFRSGGGRF